MIDLQKTDNIHLEVEFDDKRLMLLWDAKDDFAIVQAECTERELSEWLAKHDIPILVGPNSFLQIGQEVSFKIDPWDGIPAVLNAVRDFS
ncbi:hypothetical protein UFOVP75_201 [uncultured Caudovirales phage]|uniref:Uncharacterized protein n=1 Tax=uncultured Caudovirales phage TaxID=2100421 RepID=A0A6J5L2J1_9CAUD|nr:hypothetical protein UFOVP75_201 [uncultured Caudovirales phage]